MTNSLNTPVEALEYAYPLRVTRYSYRPGSGGSGKYRGGDGLIREIQLLSDARITLLTDRRRFPPYGLAGRRAGSGGKDHASEQKGCYGVTGKVQHYCLRRGCDSY